MLHTAEWLFAILRCNPVFKVGCKDECIEVLSSTHHGRRCPVDFLSASACAAAEKLEAKQLELAEASEQLSAQKEELHCASGRL